MTGGEAPDMVPPLPLPPLRRVEATFEYTFDELHEGLTQSPDLPVPRRAPLAMQIVAAILLLVLVAVGLIVLYANPTTPTAPAGVTPAPSASPVEFVVAVAPSLFAAGFVAILAAMMAAMLVAQTARSERVRRAAKPIVLAGMLVAALLAWTALSVFDTAPPEDAWSLGRGQALLLSLAPWMVLVVLIIAFLGWFNRNQLRRQWASKPYLRRRRTVVLDDEGERVADEMTQMLYRWPCFTRAWETANVLVLQDENDLRHILPKRAMDPATLDAARAVIGAHVADCKFQVTPSGFPVQSRDDSGAAANAPMMRT